MVRFYCRSVYFETITILNNHLSRSHLRPWRAARPITSGSRPPVRERLSQPAYLRPRPEPRQCDTSPPTLARGVADHLRASRQGAALTARLLKAQTRASPHVQLLDPSPPTLARGAADHLEASRQGAALTARLLKAQTSCLLYTSPSPRDLSTSRMPSSA